MNKNQKKILILGTVLFVPLCFFAGVLSDGYNDADGLAYCIFAAFFILLGVWIFSLK